VFVFKVVKQMKNIENGKVQVQNSIISHNKSLKSCFFERWSSNAALLERSGPFGAVQIVSVINNPRKMPK